MNSRQELDLKLFYDKEYFYNGEPIKGNLILKTQKPSIIEKIKVVIKFVQGWKINGEPLCLYKGIVANCEIDLSKISNINKVQGCYIIPAGENIIPFNIILNNYIDPCFEYPLGDIYAYLRYAFDVHIYSSSFDKNFWNFYLRIFSRPSVDNKKKILNKSISKTLKKWGLFGIGTTVLTVSIPDNNCKYDDSNFKIIIHIDNTKGKVSTKEARIKLIRTIEFINVHNIIKYTEEKIIFSQNIPANVAAGQKNYFDCILSLKENDISKYHFNEVNICPFNIKLNEINYYIPTIFTKIITCKYELKVSLNFESFVYENDLPYVIFPIYLVHQSPIEYQLEIQKKLLNKKNAKNMYDLFDVKKDNEKNNPNEDKKEYKNENKNIINNINYKINNINNINNNGEYNEENGNQYEAPPPMIQQNIDIDLNINNNNNIEFQNNNIINNSSKIFTNNGNNSYNNNFSSNIKYNFNININNNVDNNINNNFYNNIINGNYDIKKSGFSIFQDEPKQKINKVPEQPSDFIDINEI